MSVVSNVLLEIFTMSRPLQSTPGADGDSGERPTTVRGSPEKDLFSSVVLIAGRRDEL